MWYCVNAVNCNHYFNCHVKIAVPDGEEIVIINWTCLIGGSYSCKNTLIVNAYVT